MRRHGLSVMAVMMFVFAVIGQAHSTAVEWTFEGVNMSVPSPISTYMSQLYGSPVQVFGAELGTSGWGYDNEFLWTAGSAYGDFEIRFVDVPITRVYGSTLGRVFDATDGADFTLKAYGAGFGSVENPSSSSLIYSHSWWTGEGSVDIPDITFSSPVYLLVASNEGRHDVGIDNLKVEKGNEGGCGVAVPEPGTLLLVGSGLVGLGIVRRKERTR